jgi:hypothetical protein
MEIYMMVNGLKASKMDRVSIMTQQLKFYIKDNGKKVKKVVLVF